VVRPHDPLVFSGVTALFGVVGRDGARRRYSSLSA
jgi:hypothetical protein